MSKYQELFEYLRQCPNLKGLWSIAATEEMGTNVIIPVGASEAYQYAESLDVNGDYECDIVPYPSIFEDYQINCYKTYDPRDNSAPSDNINVLSLDEVQAVCDWIMEQNESGNLPNISGKKVVAIECVPFSPQVRGVDIQQSFICYFITLRIRYVNPLKGRSAEYAD